MAYTATSTELPGVLVLEPRVFGDARGFFFESFSAREFEKATGLRREFVQDNHSLSGRGVLRGLHIQLHQPQGKLVRVIRGEIFDVAVDVRLGSPTFGKWAAATLSAENKKQLWVPEGFAHGFAITSEVAEVAYKVTAYWQPEHEQTVLWNDPQIGIDWPIAGLPVLSAKDADGRPLSQIQLQ